MATTVTTTPDRDIYLARPFHATDMKAFYGASDKFTTGIDITTLKSAIDTLIATFKDGYPFASEEAFDTAADTLNSDIDSAIDGNIAQPNFQDILDEVHDDMLSVVQGDTTTFPPSGLNSVCPQCLGAGKNEGYETDGTADGVYQQSDVCDGWGYTDVPYIKNPNSGFIEAP